MENAALMPIILWSGFVGDLVPVVLVVMISDSGGAEGMLMTSRGFVDKNPGI
jgi:hypothetical protein